MLNAASIALILLSLVIFRLYMILPKTRRAQRKPNSETCSLAVFLGSGGHTSEALMLISALDFARYTPRTYIISEGDVLSAQKARSLESTKSYNPQYSILMIPRARQVHQSIYTTPITAFWSLIAGIYAITLLSLKRTRRTIADVLVVNGPGTCFILCIIIYLNKFIGLPAPQIIYVESFARVQSLSLSGKLLRPWVDSQTISVTQALDLLCNGDHWKSMAANIKVA